MKSYVARFTTHVQTCLATNQVFASCGILTSDWLKLRGSHAIHGIYVTRCKTSLLWAVKRATYHVQILLQPDLLKDSFNQ